MDELLGHPVEILAIERGRSCGTPMALVTIRPHPEVNLESILIMFDREQCCRLRDTLNRYLSDPESWIYTPAEEQAAFRELEDEVEANDEYNQ